MKKAFVKRSLLVVTAAVLASNLVACSKQSGGNATAGDTSGGAAKEVTKPTTISAMLDTTFLTPENGQQQWIDEYKKQTGIDLKITQPAHNQYYEKVNLAFASGDVPDLIEISSSYMINYAMNGALYDMTALVDKSSTMQKVEQKYKDAVKIDGKMYGFPIQGGNGPITYLRKDWLDKYNIKVPTTYDEYINMLKAFKTNNPECIPFTAPGLVSDDPSATDNYVREFYQDATPDFVKKNGKWVDGMTEPEMKAALKRMIDAYNQNLIDKEVVTNKTSTCRDKWNAGKVGAFTYWAGTWNQTLENQLKKTVKEGVALPIPAIKETKYLERVPSTVAITSKSKNPEGVFKYFVEYMHDMDKGEMLFSYGVENVNYKMVNGKVEKLPSLSDPTTPFTKSYIDQGLYTEPFKDPGTLDERVTNSLKIFNANSKMSTLLPASEEYNKASADILASRREIVSKIVLGQMTLDDGLAKYQKDTKNAVDAILKDFNKTK